MASVLFLFAIVQSIFLQIVYSQCVNRVVPNCAPNIISFDPFPPYEPYLPFEAILPNQVINQVLPIGLPALPNGLPGVPANYQLLPVSPAAYQALPVIPEPVLYAPTVINDNSVANNLANALQLLVVSNLLSATLPGGCDPYYIEPYPIGPIGPYNMPYPTFPYPVNVY